jgi:hypothetical protein
MQPILYRLQLSPHLAVSFQRTPRGSASAPPPLTSYGALPIWLANDRARRERAADALVPAMPEESFWIGIEPTDDRIATALRVGVQRAGEGTLIDAVTGRQWSNPLSSSPQNYVVSPPQRSLLGIANGDHEARRFTTLAASNGSRHGPGTLRLQFVNLLPSHVPSLPPPPPPIPLLHGSRRGSATEQPSGNAAGPGTVPQRLAPDPYGLNHWSLDSAVTAMVRLVPPAEFEQWSGWPRPEPLDPSKIYGGWHLP